MAVKTTSTKEKTSSISTLNSSSIIAGIKKLDERVKQHQEAKDRVSNKTLPEGEIADLVMMVNNSLRSIFGLNSYEYDEWQFYEALYYDTSMYSDEYQEAQTQKRKIETHIAKLRSIKNILEERLVELSEGALIETNEQKALSALDKISIHAEIEKAASNLFRDGHYAESIEAACKKLDSYVLFKSNTDSTNRGTSLMREVFSAKAPILKINTLEDKYAEGEQEGLMHLFEGAMMFLRNPRAHELRSDNGQRAIKYLMYISLLAELVDECQN